jgi:Voltage-dependent L-type calcium channel, IQ-associated
LVEKILSENNITDQEMFLFSSFLICFIVCFLPEKIPPIKKLVNSGKIHYTEMYDMLKNMDPPLGFGNKCPNRLAYKKLIRMNMPLDVDGKVAFTTTLFALIRENLNMKMRTGNV